MQFKTIFMNKILETILDLPKTVNEKLPKNFFNEMLENSEESIKKWTGLVFKVGALVLLVVTLTSVISDGINSFNGEGLEIISGVLCSLILIYAAFPISQIIRNAGDALAGSKSKIVDFVFKDFIVENIKALGHITALVALFGAICSTVGFILNSEANSLSLDLFSGFSYAYALPVGAAAQFLEMLNLGFVAGVLNDFFSWDLTTSAASGYTVEGLISLGWEYVQVILILAKLYFALAVYNFFYKILTALATWIKGPYLPFKSL